MKKGEYRFGVRSYECGADAFASLPAVCNYLQEAASLNAEELGFSKSDFDARGENVSWVLTRLAVKMFRYPVWEEEVTVVTFPRGGRKIVAWRDFEIKSADGGTIGLATSEWMLIDLATRKIAPIPQSVLDACEFGSESVLGAEPFTARLKFPADVSVSASGPYKAQYSHIDLNGHVNNVHYVEWALESVPEEYRRRSVSRLDIVFRQEAKAGDELESCSEIAADGILRHAITRVSDGALLATAETGWRDS